MRAEDQDMLSGVVDKGNTTFPHKDRHEPAEERTGDHHPQLEARQFAGEQASRHLLEQAGQHAKQLAEGKDEQHYRELEQALAEARRGHIFLGLAMGLFMGAIGCGLILAAGLSSLLIELTLLGAAIAASVFARDRRGIVEAWRRARREARVRAVERRLSTMQERIAARRAGLAEMIARCERAASLPLEASSAERTRTPPAPDA